jgi:hypothetical protein
MKWLIATCLAIGIVAVTTILLWSEQPDTEWYVGKIKVDNTTWYVSIVDRSFIKNCPEAGPDVRLLDVTVRNKQYGRIFGSRTVGGQDWTLSPWFDDDVEPLPKDYPTEKLLEAAVTLVYHGKFKVSQSKQYWRASSPVEEYWEPVFVNAELVSPSS